MIKLDLTAVLYSKKNYDIEFKLHKMCQNFNINLVNVLDFVELAIKSLTLKPKIIFCDCATVSFSSSNIEAFMQREEFKNSKIISDVINNYCTSFYNRLRFGKDLTKEEKQLLEYIES